MRLLIVTQKADEEAPILGFVIRWLRVFSTEFDSIEVIAQWEGKHGLPANVRVHSLRKERGLHTSLQILRCWKLAWQLRHEYDVVLVHMTPIWMVLNGPLWWMLSKPRYLWYESPGRKWSLFAALAFVSKVFSATDLKLRLFHGKNIVTNHGVDTDFWTPSGERDPSLIVTMSRVSTVKRIELVIRCFASLPSHYRLVIIGEPFVGSDIPYYKEMEQLIGDLGLLERVSMHFMDSRNALATLRRAQLFLHASNGTLDKSILQAMSCGTMTVSCSRTNPLLPEECRATPETFGTTAAALLEKKESHERIRSELREIVLREHSLLSLAKRLRREMKERAGSMPVAVAALSFALHGCQATLA